MLIIDVRKPDEYAAGHVMGAVNIPLNTLTSQPAELDAGAKAEPIVVYCNSGARSEQAKAILNAIGYSQVINGINQATVESNLG